MRTFVLILMIALLPLRMWAAEGLAVRVAQEQVAAAEMSAMDSMPEDCPMMAKAKAEHGSQDESPGSITQCITCHLCAAAACVPEVAFEQGPTPTGPPEFGSSRYLSAYVAPDLRPPIS
jgi:hypothetical protein